MKDAGEHVAPGVMGCWAIGAAEITSASPTVEAVSDHRTQFVSSPQTSIDVP
jgi:hypothetical protein